jgi:Cu(I)/Ag(I) efflux system membrane fusion protein
MMKTSRMAWSIGVAMVLASAAGLTFFACSTSPGHESRAATATTLKYHCPMHPSYVSDRPGDCPICGMKLVASEHPTAPTAAGGASGPRKPVYYRSPMDPSVRSEVPTKDAMGMDLVPVYPEELASGSSAVAGRAVITLTPERRQLLGIRSQEVRQGRVDRTIRTVGRIAPDERRVHHIHMKFEGYVEHLYVDFVGKLVKQGEPLLSIYSPELVATQQEYLLALRAQRQLAASNIGSVAQGGVDLLEAARDRLRLWDIREEDIAELERTGNVRRSLNLYAEGSGYVMQKNVVHGMRVMPSDTLFDIADLSRLWVLADIYESDLPSIGLGMPAEMTVPYLPDKTWRGPVTNIAPTVEEKTRTVKVRIEVDNQADALKPDMFGDVFLRVDGGTGLIVPESAVIDSGDRKLVFLDHPDGRLEPREVQLGAKLPSGFLVLKGLSQGDRVVTAANFLLDSESSLKAALSSMGTPPPGLPAPQPAGHQH